ncbi:Barstar domain containing protein [Streptomyces sp. NPDC093224]|uniref:Barstar domain containing protein n=1 Tax=Streptomyces sp. NPDC093224 TaxID=3155198 RepID=UPI003437338C
MRISARASGGQKYSLTSDEDDGDFWGFVHEAEGLFTPLPESEGARRVHLAGCLPQGHLLNCVDHVGSPRAVAGNAWFEFLDSDGVTMGSYFVNEVTVMDVKSSDSGAGLVDLMATLGCEDALPGAGRAWDLVRTDHLNRTGMWHELTPADRRAWLSVALWSREYQRRGKPDAPAGQVFTLDGRHIVDRDTFWQSVASAFPQGRQSEVPVGVGRRLRVMSMWDALPDSARQR